MIKGLFTAAGGMLPRIVQQDAAAENLAYVSTNGYKKSEVFLRRLIDASSALDRAMGREQKNGPEELRTDFTQGTFDPTEVPFDLALNGPGFFRLQDASGAMYYTRNGKFHLNPDGVVVNTANMPLLDTAGAPIRVSGETVAITGDGTVEVDGEKTVRIAISDFDPKGYRSLVQVGKILYRKPTSTAETPASTATQVMQGYLENSNVDEIRLMVDMIEILRSFEMGQKSIQIQDQTLQRVVTELGAVR